MHKDIELSLLIFGIICLTISILTNDVIFNFSLIINITLSISIERLSFIFPQYIHFTISLNILKSKLIQIEENKNKEFLNSFSDSSMINFGSQIRTYTLEPFQLVKDHRSNYEVVDAYKFLDGEIMEMLENNLSIE